MSLPALPEFDDPDDGVELPDFDDSEAAAPPRLPDFDQLDEDRSSHASSVEAPRPVFPDFVEADDDDPTAGEDAQDASAVYPGPPDYRRTPSGIALGQPCDKPARNQHLNRLNPYFAGVWERGSSMAWDSAESLRDRFAASGLRLPEGFTADRFEAVQYLRSQPAEPYLSMLSVLDSWGIVTAQQMAAFTGRRSLADPYHPAVMALFSAGLIQIGRMQYGFNDERLAAEHTAYRLISRRGIRRVFGRWWTSAEYLQCDGGQFWWPMSGYLDRHNILASELALRAAESMDACALVLGEKWCNGRMLFPSDYEGISGRERQPVRPDAAVLLRNGLRVLIELQASTNPKSFNRKIQRYARLMIDKPLDASGIVVVFVSAPAKVSASGASEAQHRVLERHLEGALENWPSRGEDSPGRRIGFARWEDYFTSENTLTEAFHGFSAQFPAVSAQPVSLVQMDRSFTPHSSFDPSAALRNGPVLAATPWWMRRGDHTPMIGCPSAATGYSPPQPQKHLVVDTGALRAKALPPARLQAAGRARAPRR